MKAIFTLLSLIISSFIFANNIQLQKVSLADTNRTAKTVNIKMNISWEHSWRDSINWDAAWIIVKYKEPKDSIWKWKHAQFSKTGNNTGTQPGLKIVVPDDLNGAFFYRSAIGAGNIASNDVKFIWNYGSAGVTNIDSVEVRVFATEMVYVPEGNYCLGDGDGLQRSDNSFQLKNAPNNYAVITDKWSPLINTQSSLASGDDQSVKNSGIRVSGLQGLDVNDDKVPDFPNYPTGYRAFYCMKYKVTQGQYTDFLNTTSVNDTTASVISNAWLTSDPSFLKSMPKPLQAAWRQLGDFIYMFIYPTDKARHTITFDSLQLKFIVTRPDRAYALMDINKGLSFSEWAGLRPMSEMEFEKASRGPLPAIRNEFAWGADSMYANNSTYTLSFNGIENGTEYFTDYDITKRYTNPINTRTGDGGTGPYRVGIFATDNSSRISSNASYYGIMDMSKMYPDGLVSANGSGRELNYLIHGAGKLDALGNSYSFKNIKQQLIGRTSVSARYQLNSSFACFRAVRLAPSDN